MSLVHIIKFIHVLLALGLLSSVLFAVACIYSKNAVLLVKINKWMLIFIVIAALTGTFLVLPAHFTFHTPWIKAAYLLVGVFSVVTLSLLILQKKNVLPQKFQTFIYLLLFILLMFVVHDAVTKTTFLFGYF